MVMLTMTTNTRINITIYNGKHDGGDHGDGGDDDDGDDNGSGHQYILEHMLPAAM